MALNQSFWTNLKGLSCAFCLLFGTFSLLILSVLVGLYTLYLSNFWPYILVLSISLVAFISWTQLNAMRSEERAEEGSSHIISSVPTIAGLLSARGSPTTFASPPPYCEALLYQVFKHSEGSAEAGSAPPPSYDEAIKLTEMIILPGYAPKTPFHDKNNQNSRTFSDPHDIV